MMVAAHQSLASKSSSRVWMALSAPTRWRQLFDEFVHPQGRVSLARWPEVLLEAKMDLDVIVAVLLLWSA